MLASSTLVSSPRIADAQAEWKAFPTGRRALLAFFVAACLVGLGFSLYTQQIWEDALITLRFSENLLKGEGLVYNPGERVHGFTSPINVLLLTLCHLLTGQTSYVATLWLYRIFTIAAFAGGGVFVLRAMLHSPPQWIPALWFAAIVYLFEPKTVAYSTNGMETGFMLLLVGWAIYLWTRNQEDCWLARGLCWGGLMWTRPDGCVYIVALALAELTFFRSRPGRDMLKSLVKSAGICVLVYAPWFFWAWWYYGSPIPHTVIAKSNIERGSLTQILETLEYLPDKLFAVAGRGLRPVQFTRFDTWIVPAGWAHVTSLLSKAISGFALVYWLFPVRDSLGRAASLCFMVLCLYFSFQLIQYLWYFPPAAVFGLVAVARGISMLATSAHARKSMPHRIAWRGTLAAAALSFLAIGQVALFVRSTRAESIWQQEIEDGQRAAIGRWLKEHGAPGQTVYLEPLGYIGYFSGMKMIDYPGLVSPEMVRVRREKQTDLVGAIRDLMPDWVILRYAEVKSLLDSPYGEQFNKDYAVVQRFNVNEKLDQYGSIHEKAYIRYDAAFAVFRKNASLPALSPPALPPGVE